MTGVLMASGTEHTLRWIASSDMPLIAAPCAPSRTLFRLVLYTLWCLVWWICCGRQEWNLVSETLPPASQSRRDRGLRPQRTVIVSVSMYGDRAVYS
jgi:hypothetical protein